MRPQTLALVLLAAPALASEYTELASSGDPEDPFDFNLSVGYNRALRRAAIKRELTGVVGDESLARPLIVKDLRYTQVTHTLPIRAEIGLWQDLQLHVTIPLVVSDTRELAFARNEGDSCTFPGQEIPPELPNCVDARNSTAVRDGLIPGVGPDTVEFQGENGFGTIASQDMPMTLAGGARAGALLPARSGLDQIHIGMDYAILSQARDDTKPTWVVGFEARPAVGGVMDYDPDRPEDNTSVGRGVHEFVFQTAFSKSTQYLEPFIHIWYALPVASKKARFYDYGGGQDKAGPQQRAGVDFGLEVFAMKRPEEHQKVGIEVAGHISGAFEGRGYSEMWEVFRNNSRLSASCGIDDNADGTIDAGEQWANCDVRPGERVNYDINGDGAVDAMDVDPDGQIRHPGITDVENYGTFGGSIAIRTEVGQYIKFRIGAALSHDLEHFITFADAGEDGPDEDYVVTPDNHSEINPIYRPLIDQIGRRFRVEETTVFDFFVNAQVLF